MFSFRNAGASHYTEFMGEHGNSIPYLTEAMVFLAAAVLVVPIFRYFKISAVLGYLFAGIVVGPYGAGLVQDIHAVQGFAELGVVFLLFTIGLELSYDRLVSLRRFVFGLGGAQVAVTMAVIGGIAYGFGEAPGNAIVIGASLALSSTAIVLQLLAERGEMATRHGRATFAVLLFQDLAVVPILILVAVLAPGQSQSFWVLVGETVLKAAVAFAFILFAGRFLIQPLFRMVAASRTSEIFVAMTLLAALATALITREAGLSAALGAFLAGTLLSGSEFRHQIVVDIEPFKGLLLGLFFMSVGMGLDIGLAAKAGWWIPAALFALIFLKGGVLVVLARLFGLPLAVAARIGLLLAQGGEFVFVVIGAAETAGVLRDGTGPFLFLITGLSMALTPLLVAASQKIAEALSAKAQISGMDSDIATDELGGHVIICGYGRVGETVALLLRERHVPYVALDLDTTRVNRARKNGEPVLYGDAAREDVLARVGAARASAIVVALDSHRANVRAVRAIRERWPSVPVFARLREARFARDFIELGAAVIVPETLESSLQLAGQVLRELGDSPESVNALIDHIRAEHYARIADAGDSKPG